MGVEVAGRFIGENDAGMVDQGPSDSYALLLAAGQLARPMPGTVGQVHGGKRRQRPLPPFLAGNPTVDHRKLDVLNHIQFGQQVEKLEHEPDFPIADRGQLPGGGLLDHDPVQLDRPVSR